MSSNQVNARILVVDDSPDTVEIIERNLTAAGYGVMTAPDVAQAIEVLGATEVDLVVTDLKMPGSDGLDLVRHVQQNCADTEVMMITGYATVEGAVEAIKSGAEAYLQKPFTEQELLEFVARALDKLHARRTVEQAEQEEIRTPWGLIGDSPAMRRVYEAITKASRSSATALISGDSGTGKELVARAIHYAGDRGASRFVAVNCGGIPESLLESELFGYVKGAFTGADETRAGFFQTADGGTLFLDEISETSLAMQVKLLRVLQEKEVCMVGSNRTRAVDVRIIAATNKDLEAMVAKGLFREDLYYRLDVIGIELPPLRERGDDILQLIAHFTSKYAAEAERPVPRFSEAALDALRSYYWPGNVRELENVIHRLLVMIDGDLIDAPDLPASMRQVEVHAAALRRSLAEVEREHIRNVLTEMGGNKTRAAEVLGIDRKTLREKLK